MKVFKQYGATSRLSITIFTALSMCVLTDPVSATDALWALSPDGTTISVCQNPTSNVSLGNCFGANTQITLPAPTISTANDAGTGTFQPVTDGTYVYFGSFPSYRCSIAGNGDDCTQIQIGWGNTLSNMFSPNAVAAANGYLWIGTDNLQDNQGTQGAAIYRCPSNLPYTNASSMPAECVLLAVPNSKNAGMSIGGLVYSNGMLYVGVNKDLGPSYLYSCDPYQLNTCTQLDEFGQIHTAKNFDICKSIVTALTVGGGSVWVGLSYQCDLSIGTITKVDPTQANTQTTWETAAWPINSLADDGQNTLWAAASNNAYDNVGKVTNTNDVIWSCPEAFANGCTTEVDNVFAWQVTASAGFGFSSNTNRAGNTTINFGKSQYTQSSIWSTYGVGGYPQILYVPSNTGALERGGFDVRISYPNKAKLAQVCAVKGTLPVSAVLRGKHHLRITRQLDLCSGTSPVDNPKLSFDLLSPGSYSLKVSAGSRSRIVKVVVEGNKTKLRSVALK